jgi:hypothetical protein
MASFGAIGAFNSSKNFLSSRGAVYKAITSKIEKYTISPDFRQSGINSATIFTGYTINEQEIVAQAACLNDLRVMYTFGKGFGSINVTGEMLLGAPEARSRNEGQLYDYYEKNRVSQLEKPVSLSLGAGRSLKFFLVGLNISQYSVDFEILPFQLIGVIQE